MTGVNNPLTTRNTLKYEIERYGWNVGEHSYGAPLVFEHEYGMLTIGRYCSIALGTTLLLANHRMDRVSTYPFKVLAEYWPGAADGAGDHEDRGGIEIGSDVWLGAQCTVVAGVRIGSGAVVAASSVVTKDVPPYAIVAGNPARIVRSRCGESQARDLLEIAWWNWPDDKVKRELHAIMSLDVDAFIARYLPSPTP